MFPNVLPETIYKKNQPKKTPNLFVVETKQLPTTESEKHAPAKDGGDSVVNTFNIKTDSVKNSSLYLETEEAAKMANFQEEMQSEVDNGEVGKY